MSKTVFFIIIVLLLLLVLLVVLFPQLKRCVSALKALYTDRKRRIEAQRLARIAEQERQERERREREAAERERKRLQQEQAEHLKQTFLQQNPYIAWSDWQVLKKKILDICPFYSINDAEQEQRNKQFREQQLGANKEYFDTLLAFPLDEQQRQAIVTLGENVLVVAAAGSGKTATIVAKTHFLVHKMHVDPRSILVVTYTRKAAEELQTRIGVSGVECTTFHKHAIDTIAAITGEKPTICESNLLNTVFDSMVKHSTAFESSFLLFQTVQKTLLQYDYKYHSYKDYLNALKEYGKMAPYRDMDGKICYVKSRQEMEIMVILTELGLQVRYEEKYPYPTAGTRFRQYKPDFTIHYTLNGKDQTLYLEHYAIDENGHVPLWFGDGKQGGWAKANRDYNEAIHWKQQLHADNGTTLIYTTSADFHDGIQSARARIIALLKEQGVPVSSLTIEEKAEKMAVPLKRSIESLIKLLAGFIALIKANSKTVPELLNGISDKDTYRERNSFLLRHLVQPVYDKYEDALRTNHEMDFTDCLLHAAKLLEQKQIYNYDYILVDEFQDMSMDKYRYLSALRRTTPCTRIFCVGDDWQSIYRFSGSDISLFSQFPTFNGHTDELKIEATHRFGNPLLERSSEFILRNPAQKKKTLRADKDRTTYLAFAGYENEKQERQIIENQMAKLPTDARVYILSRYRYDIGSVFPEVANVVKGENGGAISLTLAGRKVQALTAHSSKGLEADYVFLINCNSGYDDYGFPSQVADDPIMEYVLSRSDSYDHAEERRLFYVAITRAKRAAYVLYSKQYPSLFVTELGGCQTSENHSKRVCPRCGTGTLMFAKDGYAKNGHFYTVLRCTNKACDLQNETIFFNAEKEPYEIVAYEQFLQQRKVTTEERIHIAVTTSPDFVWPVLHIPCAAYSRQGLDVAIDPRFDRYDLAKFYMEHLQKGDLAVCIQHRGDIERLLLTVVRPH